MSEQIKLDLVAIAKSLNSLNNSDDYEFRVMDDCLFIVEIEEFEWAKSEDYSTEDYESALDPIAALQLMNEASEENRRYSLIYVLEEALVDSNEWVKS